MTTPTYTVPEEEEIDMESCSDGCGANATLPTGANVLPLWLRKTVTMPLLLLSAMATNMSPDGENANAIFFPVTLPNVETVDQVAPLKVCTVVGPGSDARDATNGVSETGLIAKETPIAEVENGDPPTDTQELPSGA